MTARLLIAAALAGLLAVACGGAGDRSVLVSAASSLGDAFAAMEAAFEEGHADVDIVLNLGGTSALREQILGGAPADVFASADAANMARVDGAGGLADRAVSFARNRLEIAVPPGNPGGVTGLADIGRDELLIGLCAASVPCGALARTELASAGVEPAADTEEPSVRALLAKVADGELDAGLVYTTDVAASGGRVVGIALPETASTTEYLIAVLAEAPNPGDAADFVNFVLSEQGRAILADHGFLGP